MRGMYEQRKQEVENSVRNSNSSSDGIRKLATNQSDHDLIDQIILNFPSTREPDNNVMKCG